MCAGEHSVPHLRLVILEALPEAELPEDLFRPPSVPRSRHHRLPSCQQLHQKSFSEGLEVKQAHPDMTPIWTSNPARRIYAMTSNKQ